MNFDGTKQLEGRYRDWLDRFEMIVPARLDAEGRLIAPARDKEAWNTIAIVCSAIGDQEVVLSQLPRDIGGIEDTGFQALFTGP